MSNDHIVRGVTVAGTNSGSFAPHHKAEADVVTADLDNYVLSDGSVDEFLDPAEAHLFDDAAVRAHHRIYQSGKVASSERRLASERCSIIRTKRVAVLVSELYPDATGIRVEENYGEGSCTVRGIDLADGTRLDVDDHRFAYDQIEDEVFDIYANNDGWKGVATEVNDVYTIDIAKAKQISRDDIERGFITH